MKILFLETRQNEVWVSMQEILPHIKNVWLHLASQKGWEMNPVDVDNSSPTSFRSQIVSADLIVVPAFNARVAQTLMIIRKMLGIETPWVFYLHNQATIGLWPLFSLGIGDLLHKDDIFMGTCDGDEDALSLSLINAQYFKTYFSTEDDLENLPPILDQGEEIKDIVFVGRISAQKNLHSLLLAFKELKKRKPALKLHLYGKEDNLGSPNMEWKGSGYQALLNQIIYEEDIEDVNFYGFVNRDSIKNAWRAKPFVFCSPSLHSDENFGMAALSAIEGGGLVVLSDWGGHKNFGKEFPERVHLVPVLHNGSGPFIEVDSLIDKLEKVLKDSSGQKPVSSPFCLYKISQRVGEFLEGYFSSERTMKLEVLELTKTLVKKRKEFYEKDKALLQKVFDDYSDPLAEKFFEAYGANKGKANGGNSLVPWAVREDEKIKISDPIKREALLKEEEAQKMGYFYSGLS